MERLALAALLYLAVAACQDGDISRREGNLEDLLADRAAHELHLGLEPDTGARPVLTFVYSARFTDSGQHIVIADRTAPFIRVYTRDGRLRSSFISASDGPTEARAVISFSLLGDSVVVLTRATNFSKFNFDGTPGPFAPRDPMMSIESIGCAGRLFVYGPTSPQLSARQGWVHEVRWTAENSARVRPVYMDSVVNPTIAFGKPARLFMRDGNTLYLFHENRGKPALLRYECDSTEGVAQLVSIALYQPAVPPEGIITEESVDLELRAGKRHPAGYLIHDTLALWFEDVILIEPKRTIVTVLVDGKPHELAVAGSYRILDVRRNDAVLIATDEPVPQVFSVRVEDLRRALRLDLGVDTL